MLNLDELMYGKEAREREVARLKDWASKAPPAVAARQHDMISRIEKMTTAQYRRYCREN